MSFIKFNLTLVLYLFVVLAVGVIEIIFNGLLLLSALALISSVLYITLGVNLFNY